MYCSACGIALSQPMKYCKRCGTQLITTRDAAEVEASEKRLDEYLDGLFWITVFGLGLILGGLVLMKKALHLSDGLIIAYLVLSALAFSINFALNLREILRLMRSSKEAKGIGLLERLDTNELNPENDRIALEAVPSVTENTTRNLEPRSKEQIT
jgi:hypothetical protein